MCESIGMWLWSWRWHVLLAAACLCMHVVAARVAEALWWRPRRLEAHFARHGIRGPRYRLFVGSSLELVKLMTEALSRPVEPPASHDVLPRALGFFHHWRKLYGPTFLMWFGPSPRLATTDLDLIREVVLAGPDRFDRFKAPPLIGNSEGRGLAHLHGEPWARHRKLLTPAFHTENLKLLTPCIGKAVAGMLENLSEALPVSGEVEVDVLEWYDALAEEGITLATFGRSYDDGKAVFQLQAKLMSYVREAYTRVFIPGYRFLPIKKNRHSWQLDREIRKKLARFIAGRRNGGDVAHDYAKGSGMKDLMSFMTPAMTVEEVTEHCKNLFVAAKETTSSLLTWMTVALAMHPEWQERARSEAVSVCGARDLPSKDHLPKLKTLSMIVNETLRLYPPAVAIIRTAQVDVEIGGCPVPAGTEVLIPIMAIHHDRDVWGPDAAEFNPGRFAAQDAPPRHLAAFMPFGAGARICIGQNLALMEAKIAMAAVLQRFSFRLSPSYVHAPRALMILRPQHGAPVIFRPL